MTGQGNYNEEEKEHKMLVHLGRYVEFKMRGNAQVRGLITSALVVLESMSTVDTAHAD